MEETQVKPPAPSAARFAGLAKNFREWCELIKVEHTVFALPFALAGLVLAGEGLPSIQTFFFTILAFAGARSAAMSLNRVIDAAMDARNPRTSQRSIPAGRIKKNAAIIFAVLSFVVMIAAASQLPPLCLKLSPIAVIWLSFYSYTKRFTWLCHFFLGIALGGAALGGWIAGGGNLASQAPWILALAVSTWVAGFDIIYACQDYQFDTSQKVFSIPARFGIATALIVSSALHMVTALSLCCLGVVLDVGLAYWLGVVLVSIMLVYEHAIVSSKDLSRINAAFFNVNGVVSILAFVFILVDKLLKERGSPFG
jgi:4-hydroxybenzoate polyprenyltransferase